MRPAVFTVTATLALLGCDAEGPSQGGATTVGGATVQTEARPSNPRRWYSPEQAAAGTGLYNANCAACHGQDGEGAFAWRKRGADGKYPPPPLNGTGHTWHHPLPVLHRVIRKGSPGGQGNMPAWEGKLSDAEILAMIAYFQSWWPDQVYVAWSDIDARARAGGRR